MRSYIQKQWFWYVLYAVITLGTCLLIIFGVPKKIAGLYQDLMLRTLFLTCFLLMTGVYFWKRIKEEHKQTAIVLIFGFFMTTLFVFLFRNTYYGYSGDYGDAEFILASITKYAHFWTWVDFSYQDLSAFYPPLYFYLLGKLAWLLQIEPYQIVRYGFWAVVFVLPWLMVSAWSRITDRSFAVLLTMTSMLFFFRMMIYKPYEFITMVMIIPWWFTFVEPQTPLPQEKNTYRKFVLLGGFLGSLIFQTYYYWLFAFAIYWIAAFVWQWIQEGTVRPILSQYKHSLYVLLSMLLFSMLYIGPLLWDAFKYGMYPLQNKWFYSDMLKVFDFQLDSPLTSVLFLLGFASLLYFSQQKQFVKKILFLVISCYAWQWIGHLGVVLKKPNLHFKMVDFLLFLLIIGFCYLIFFWDQKAKGRIWIAAVLILFLTLGQQVVEFQKSTFYHRAFKTKIPAEVKYLEQFHPKGKVILSNNSKFTVYLPVFDFINPVIHYSHHSSRREERLAFLQELSQHKNPAFVAWMLTYNKFDKVDYIYLKNFTLSTLHDRFPFTYWGARVTIRFAPEVFTSKFFIDRGKGFYEVRPISKDVYRTFNEEEMKLVKKYADETVLKP